MCSSQRSQAFELATTTEQLQVGGGYTVLSTRLTLHPPSYAITCLEPEKIYVKFHKNCENRGKVWKFLLKDVILWNLTFIFSGSRKKFSLVSLQIPNYIYSPSLRSKRFCAALVSFHLSRGRNRSFFLRNQAKWKRLPRRLL